MLEMNQLRCFVTVAEELHFNRAAERLNMTQPPLSRQIQMLERGMDCQLFTRTSRSVALTEAGKSFLIDAQRILRLFKAAQETARNISLGQTGVLRCGFTAVTAYRFLPMLIQQMNEHIPGCRLDLKEMVTSHQIEALDTGELDIGLLRPPVDRRHYADTLVSREKLLLAMPTGHRLSRRKLARWRDLDGEDFIMYDSVDAKYFHDLLAVFLTRKRVQPNIVQTLTQNHSILSLVRTGMGVAVVPESARILDIADVVYREFSDQQSPYAELLLVWRTHDHNPLIPAIEKIAGALLE